MGRLIEGLEGAVLGKSYSPVSDMEGVGLLFGSAQAGNDVGALLFEEPTETDRLSRDADLGESCLPVLDSDGVGLLF